MESLSCQHKEEFDILISRFKKIAKARQSKETSRYRWWPGLGVIVIFGSCDRVAKSVVL